ncbi:hypothetical protein GUITHDRAFT_121203 [Guillardia theta CCMP2712]|uniref:Fibronectin type-III domain-containing protein n=2 Tax=Guillardia theta TaxID=55529 RepID=L1I929_GUITC|nr:hypothetical protein GUITHDRAFT_121203 [Guillardia theta CCMP2712]EKX32612.1 hypothetical protein GUITHDRAFT_121203 [Guillardia theta CCMP2712]|eukprot:XP_005819592.1 hypothetical protein GUITHDRAFT_121203 [Guillardia theta CCMP2712]
MLNAPTIPQRVRLYRLDNSSLSVRWDCPASLDGLPNSSCACDPCGSARGFSLTLYVGTGKGSMRCEGLATENCSTVQLTLNVTEYVFDSLLDTTLYEVSLFAFHETRVGAKFSVGPFTINPNPPYQPMLSQYGVSLLQLAWSRPLFLEEPSHFMLQFADSESSFDPGMLALRCYTTRGIFLPEGCRTCGVEICPAGDSCVSIQSVSRQGESHLLHGCSSSKEIQNFREMCKQNLYSFNDTVCNSSLCNSISPNQAILDSCNVSTNDTYCKFDPNSFIVSYDPKTFLDSKGVSSGGFIRQYNLSNATFHMFFGNSYGSNLDGVVSCNLKLGKQYFFRVFACYPNLGCFGSRVESASLATRTYNVSTRWSNLLVDSETKFSFFLKDLFVVSKIRLEFPVGLQFFWFRLLELSDLCLSDSNLFFTANVDGTETGAKNISCSNMMMDDNCSMTPSSNLSSPRSFAIEINYVKRYSDLRPFNLSFAVCGFLNPRSSQLLDPFSFTIFDQTSKIVGRGRSSGELRVWPRNLTCQLHFDNPIVNETGSMWVTITKPDLRANETFSIYFPTGFNARGAFANNTNALELVEANDGHVSLKVSKDIQSDLPFSFALFDIRNSLCTGYAGDFQVILHEHTYSKTSVDGIVSWNLSVSGPFLHQNCFETSPSILLPFARNNFSLLIDACKLSRCCGNQSLRVRYPGNSSQSDWSLTQIPCDGDTAVMMNVYNFTNFDPRLEGRQLMTEVLPSLSCGSEAVLCQDVQLQMEESCCINVSAALTPAMEPSLIHAHVSGRISQPVQPSSIILIESLSPLLFLGQTEVVLHIDGQPQTCQSSNVSSQLLSLQCTFLGSIEADSWFQLDLRYLQKESCQDSFQFAISFDNHQLNTRLKVVFDALLLPPAVVQGNFSLSHKGTLDACQRPVSRPLVGNSAHASLQVDLKFNQTIPIGTKVVIRLDNVTIGNVSVNNITSSFEVQVSLAGPTASLTLLDVPRGEGVTSFLSVLMDVHVSLLAGRFAGLDRLMLVDIVYDQLCPSRFTNFQSSSLDNFVPVDPHASEQSPSTRGLLSMEASFQVTNASAGDTRTVGVRD